MKKKRIRFTFDWHSSRWILSTSSAIGLLITAFIPEFDSNHYMMIVQGVLAVLVSVGLVTDTSKQEENNND